MNEQKVKEILAKIYVDAHCKIFQNGVEYTGTLTPENSKAVNQAIASLKALEPKEEEIMKIIRASDLYADLEHDKQAVLDALEQAKIEIAELQAELEEMKKVNGTIY